MKKTAKGIVVILAAVMFVLCFSTQGSAKVNNRAKKLTKEFANGCCNIGCTFSKQPFRNFFQTITITITLILSTYLFSGRTR